MRAGAASGGRCRRQPFPCARLRVPGLVFFHSALVFSPDDDFPVKNAETTETVTVFAGFGVIWAMLMPFLVAGLGSRYSIRRHGPARFTRERLLRLGVPLLLAPVAARLALADDGRVRVALRRLAVGAFAYGVVGWSVPIVIKYAAIVTGSLAVLLMPYECVVRGTRLTRFLFGTRPDPSVTPSF